MNDIIFVMSKRCCGDEKNKIMRDLKFIRKEFGGRVFFNPNTGEEELVKDPSATEVAVYAVSGMIRIANGERYFPPMTAEDTWWEGEVPVKAGAMTPGVQFKKLIRDLPKVMVALK